MLAQIYEKLDQPADRQRELDLYNQFTSLQKTKGAGGDAGRAEPSTGKTVGSKQKAVGKRQ